MSGVAVEGRTHDRRDCHPGGHRQRRPGPNSFTAIGETTVDSETAQTFAGEGAASDAGYLAERGAVVAPATGRTFVIGARQVQPAHPE